MKAEPGSVQAGRIKGEARVTWEVSAGALAGFRKG